MGWKVPKIWKDKTCWILGGGASLTEQFEIPQELVAEVKQGKTPLSAYSPYMEKLHAEHVIAVNGAFMLGGWVDVCFFGDKQWFFNNKPQLESFHGLSVGCANFLSRQQWQTPRIKHLQMSIEMHGLCEDPTKVCWNLNSGAAAINLAYHTGCSRVVLLGFDMKLTNGAAHWHNLYGGKITQPFDKHLVGFEKIAEDAKRLGLEIINASPESAITQFEKVAVKELF